MFSLKDGSFNKKEYRKQYYLAHRSKALLKKEQNYEQSIDACRRANKLAYGMQSEQRKLAQRKHYSLNADKLKSMMRTKYINNSACKLQAVKEKYALNLIYKRGCESKIHCKPTVHSSSCSKVVYQKTICHFAQTKVPVRHWNQKELLNWCSMLLAALAKLLEKRIDTSSWERKLCQAAKELDTA